MSRTLGAVLASILGLLSPAPSTGQEIKEKTILLGHEKSDIRSLAFSPDGSTLASASSDGTVILWDVATESKKAHLKGHADYVSCVGFWPNRNWIASVSWGDDFRLWDSDTGKQIKQFKLKSHWFKFSADGNFWAYDSGNNTVSVVETNSAKEVALCHWRESSTMSAAFQPDGKVLAVGVGGGEVILWDIAKDREKAVLQGHKRAVESVVFSSDGKYLASGSEDKTAIVWDVATQKAKYVFDGFNDEVTEVAFSPNSRYLAAGSFLKPFVRVWDLKSGKELPMPACECKDARAVAFSPDGKLLAAGCRDKDKRGIRLWEIPSAKEGK